MDPHSLGVLEFPRIAKLVRERCVTDLGSSLADRMIPHTSISTVEDLHAKLREMLGILEAEGRLPLEDLSDINPLLSRSAAEGAALEPVELLSLLRTACGADDVSRFLRRLQERAPLLATLAAGLNPLTRLQMEIARALGPEGEVVDEASQELASIRKEIEVTRADVRRVLLGYLHSASIQRSLQDSIITLRNGRYVLPVKGGDRRTIEGIVHDHSGSGATVFIEPIETVERNNALARLQQDESREVRKILRRLTCLVSQEAGSLARNGEILGTFDFLQAKGLLSREWSGTVPALEENGPLEIRGGRHPLLERSLAAAGRQGEMVPLDLQFPDGSRTMVLTGPNTGGKTVALKTLGLFSVMAQCGLALPAEEGTRLPFFESIHADIGDEQSIDRSLSSFSAHLGQVVGLLREVGPASLVLLDEIGAGTDPAEGSALAMALLEAIHSCGATCLVTTHLGSLKVFVHDTPGMVNASMEYDRCRLCPTYLLEIGLPGTSHALEIAERLGLDPAVVGRARSYLGSSELEMESLLADLKGRKDDLETLLAETNREQERLARSTADVEERERTLREEERRWKGRSLEEAKRFLDESRSLVERLVRDIRTRAGERESVRRARQAIEAERLRLEKEIEAIRDAYEGPVRLDEAAVGRTVFVTTLNRTGRIVGEGNRSGRVFIEADGVRLEVDVADLEPAKEVGRKKARPIVVESVVREARAQLDLRGQTAEEARVAVDKFLDDAVLAGLSTVRIIHGIGTGILRGAVADLLESDSRVKAFRAGGGGGVTLAEMSN